MPVAQMLLPEFDQEMANTRKMLERVPDGKFDYKPHEKSMSLGQLSEHVAQLPWFGTVIMTQDGLDFTGDEKRPPLTSRQQLLDTFDKLTAEARPLMANASDEQFAKTWTLKIRGKELFSMPRAAVLRTMFLSHVIHHRAQLGVYLRMNDVQIPGMYGPSADEMAAFTSKSA